MKELVHASLDSQWSSFECRTTRWPGSLSHEEAHPCATFLSAQSAPLVWGHSSCPHHLHKPQELVVFMFESTPHRSKCFLNWKGLHEHLNHHIPQELHQKVCGSMHTDVALQYESQTKALAWVWFQLQIETSSGRSQRDILFIGSYGGSGQIEMQPWGISRNNIRSVFLHVVPNALIDQGSFCLG